MSEKKFQISSVYLNTNSFSFKGEDYFLNNSSTIKLQNQMQIAGIEAKALNEESGLFKLTLGIALKGKDQESDTEIFEAYVAYSMVFIAQNYTDEEFEMLTKINASSFLYPYVRAEMVKTISESALPKITLQPIDFASMYLMSKKEQKKESE